MATSVPSPSENPKLWDSIGIGKFTFPPRYPGVGCAKLTVKTGAKVDEQTANGKDRAQAKTKGRKVATGSIVFSFTREIWGFTIEMRSAIDPGGDGYGKPWEISHPEATLRKFNRLLFKDMSDLSISGDSYSFSVEYDAWDEPAAALAGGTRTPTKPEKWDPTHTYLLQENGNVIDLGQGPVGFDTRDGNHFGFGGPNKPTPEVR